jgi:hypothetical protein
MSVPDVSNAASHWAFLPTLVRLALALGTGAFVGLEREHRGKAGARTIYLRQLDWLPGSRRRYVVRI